MSEFRAFNIEMEWKRCADCHRYYAHEAKKTWESVGCPLCAPQVISRLQSELDVAGHELDKLRAKLKRDRTALLKR